ncbi:Translin [Paraphaeosphaeria sporulosa]|uniref:Translin n=1 Tax=Paraphaeosphaeria sporulosa TaxID=1460663 RepID=A0A177CTU4_9PLEO|nr:Translin [Paraphaeosphaeria sporulosa]OAG10310.1 Translin [Paraphaeosphaeria sporulosa]
MKEEKFEQPGQAPLPFMEMFEGFRAELDEHHDRRERIIKASRDITAASKKIIFTLQRVRTLGQSVPPFVVKGNAQYWEIIEKQYQHIAADVQGLNAFRYPQITGGNQEFMEALSFHHYLETQTLISYDDAKARVASMSGDTGAVLLTPEDYILGIFDMVGELMRFSITAMATNGKLPAGKPKKEVRSAKKEESEDQGADKMDVDEQTPAATPAEEPRNVLSDLRALRLQLEIFEPGGGKFGADVKKKADVMRECVDKVEKALYQLTVRGTERPKGWVPDVREERRPELESY